MCLEVRTLDALILEPHARSWVLIEKRGGSYFLAGRANGHWMDPHVAPDGIRTPCDAMRMAIAWAEYLETALLFVRDGR
jgi:hypothetical protein